MSKIVNSAIRQKILAARPRTLERLEVPEWDATIWIKELTLGERDAFEAQQIVREQDGTMRMETRGLKARLIIMCACDENGEQVFSPDDEDTLNQLGAATMERVFSTCQRVNKMRKEDLKDTSAPLVSTRNEGSDSA